MQRTLEVSLVTSDIAEDRDDQKIVWSVNCDWPSQSMVLILTVSFVPTDLIVSIHACSSLW